MMADSEAIDTETETEQHSRSGLVSEAEIEVARSVAKRMGWTPKEEWKRDPAKWRDAPEFLENTPNEIQSLKERQRRSAQAVESAMEETRRQARIDAQREIREAADAGEADRAVAAAERLASNSGPPAQTVAWLAENPWFETDPEAQALATAVINRSFAMKMTTSEQLKTAEEAVRKRFPEHFPQPRAREEERETRLSETRRPPAVQEGNRSVNTAPKVKTFADIPAADRNMYETKFRRVYETKLKPDEAKAKYAAAYWRNQGE
jgi:hypothetical protein